MTGISSIDRMPPEIRKLIDDCFERGWTVSDVTEHLRDLGADVSRSAVGRKRKAWGDIVAQVAESRTYAEVLVRSFKDAPDSKVATANVEMLQALMMRYLRGCMEKEEITLKPGDFMALGKASSSLGGARKAEVDTTITAMKAANTPDIAQDGDGGADTLEVVFVEAAPFDPATAKRKPAENAPADASMQGEAP